MTKSEHRDEELGSRAKVPVEHGVVTEWASFLGLSSGEMDQDLRTRVGEAASRPCVIAKAAKLRGGNEPNLFKSGACTTQCFTAQYTSREAVRGSFAPNRLHCIPPYLSTIETPRSWSLAFLSSLDWKNDLFHSEVGEQIGRGKIHGYKRR